MDLETFDNDASLDSAVQAIMGKMGGDREPAPKSEPRAARASEVETETDPVMEPDDQGKPEKAEAEAEQDAGDEEEDFLEIPSGEEGKEATRIRAAEAVEAYQKMRQLDADTAKVLNEREVEYQREQDTVLNELVQMHETVRTRAEAALRIIPQPQPPSRLLLDRNSEYYNPEEYHLQQIDYEQQAVAYQRIHDEANASRVQAEKTQALIAQERGRREYERLARHKGFEEWSDPAKREVHEQKMIDDLDKHFGIKSEDLVGVSSHKLFLLARAALEAKQKATTAPEVRKQVKESTVKLTKGRVMSQERGANGQFTSEAKAAREELRATGSSDAFAQLLIKSGALR